MNFLKFLSTDCKNKEIFQSGLSLARNSSLFIYFFRTFFFFFYMYMIIWSEQNTCLFVNSMPKYIHSNINSVFTYTNTGLINMYMHIYIYIYTPIHTYIIYIFYMYMEFFTKTVSNWMSFAVFADISVLDVWRCF